jgi:hypothetical protein
MCISRAVRRWPVVLAAAVGLLTFGAAQTTARARAAWCAAGQLSLSVATQNHSQQGQAGGGDLWFLQLKHHGQSACLVGGWLRLSGARTANGVNLLVKPYYESGGVGRSVPPSSFDLQRNADAFVEMWTDGPMTNAAIKACQQLAELLIFTLPHGGGRLTVRLPSSITPPCRHGQIGIARTDTSASFFAFLQLFSTGPTGPTY